MNRLLLRWGWWGLLTMLALVVFRGWPELDLRITAAVHMPGAAERFPWGKTDLVQAVYLAVPWLGRAGFFAALLMLAWPNRHSPSTGRPPWQRWRRRALALSILLVLGLWGVVNLGLKEHWGRPRPSEVSAFGGPHPFQPAGRISTLCERNCSFVSGHAATGFALLGIGLLGGPRTRRRWAWIGLGAGLFIGTGRVLQGGHFASDIVFAGLAMHGTGLLIGTAWIIRRWRRRPTPANGSAP